MGALERVGQPAPPAAIMAILDRFNREELGNTIEVLVALLDIWDGDPDGEPNGDDEPREADGDTLDAAYIEWDTKHGNLRRNGQPEILASDNEDDEEDDPPEDDDPAEDDDDDSAVDDGPCDEPFQDLEIEQMGDDVPKLPVVSAEHNIFTDKRVPLGVND